jgi:hypothetical protein
VPHDNVFFAVSSGSVPHDNVFFAVSSGTVEGAVTVNNRLSSSSLIFSARGIIFVIFLLDYFMFHARGILN